VAATGVVDDLVQSPEPARPDAAAPGTRLTFRLPRLRDPRLHVASVVVSVQVLGQVALGFDLSIAQILVSLLTAAVIEILLTAPRTRVIAWPASALLTGNGIALILRVPGTEHGDWWSLRGWYVFAATAAVGVLSKYVIRWADRPLFNPSNLALVLTFLVLGAGIADPQDLWWGPMSPGLALTYGIILVGGLVITRRLHLLAVSTVFWAVFAVLMAILAAAGHSMTARWNLGPVSGMQYWTTLVLSPEVMIFVFFMITDPRTSARGRTGGMLYAAGVAVASGVLIAFQTTEYATKVALLSGLVLVCAVRPLIERLAPATGDDSPAAWFGARRSRAATVLVGGLATVALVLVGATVAEPPTPVAAAGTRPEVELTKDQRPSVELGDGLSTVGGSFGPAEAERVVADVAAAVLLADRAVESGDTELAEAVATGPFLEDLSTRAPVAAPSRTFDTAVVDVVRDPDDFQAQPRLSVTLTGTADGAAWTSTYHVLATSADARIEREVPAG
jgi:hypothetical protein